MLFFWLKYLFFVSKLILFLLLVPIFFFNCGRNHSRSAAPLKKICSLNICGSFINCLLSNLVLLFVHSFLLDECNALWGEPERACS